MKSVKANQRIRLGINSKMCVWERERERERERGASNSREQKQKFNFKTNFSSKFLSLFFIRGIKREYIYI